MSNQGLGNAAEDFGVRAGASSGLGKLNILFVPYYF